MKGLKKYIKEIVKRNLWHSIVICFIVFNIFSGGYKYNTSSKIIHSDSGITSTFKSKNNLGIIEDVFEKRYRRKGRKSIYL